MSSLATIVFKEWFSFRQSVLVGDAFAQVVYNMVYDYWWPDIWRNLHQRVCCTSAESFNKKERVLLAFSTHFKVWKSMLFFFSAFNYLVFWTHRHALRSVAVGKSLLSLTQLLKLTHILKDFNFLVLSVDFCQSWRWLRILKFSGWPIILIVSIFF